MELTFRTAHHHDLDFIAWCNYAATSPAPGFCYWDPLLEGTQTETMQFIRAIFQHDALAWGSVEDFIVGEVSGEKVCGASGFVMGHTDYRPLRLEKLQQVQAALGWSDHLLQTFIQNYEQVWTNPLDVTLKPSGNWTVECLAVLPEYRGQGVGEKLLEALAHRGIQKGHQTMGISVTMGNQAAEKLYQKAGFRPYITYWESYFEGQFPGTIKYSKPLMPTSGQSVWG